MSQFEFFFRFGSVSSLLKNNGELKPIWIFTRDGHDGLRFPTTHQTLIKFFKDNDINYLIAGCNAAGLSVFYFTERRMTLLSKELSGIMMPHNSSGTHLDENGKTINNVKELENFKKKSELLS